MAGTATATSASNTVTIGCKLPAGLKMTIFRMEPFRENAIGGGWRDTEKAVAIGSVTINGTKRRDDDDPRIASGYALTHNVDADVWAEWLKANADTPLVKNRLIFAEPNAREGNAAARDGESLRTGLEPTDRFNVPPEFRNTIKHSVPGQS